MSRYISVEKAKLVIASQIDEAKDRGNYPAYHFLLMDMFEEMANKFLDECPPADVQEVIQARWEEDEISGFLCCSNCGTRKPYFKDYKGPLSDDSDPERVTYWESPICPMCGAKMYLEDKS